MCHRACLRDMMGQTYSIYARAGTNHARHLIGSRCILRWLEATVFMVTVENLIGRMSRAYHRNNLMYSLWKNPALLNNIDSKRFSSRCVQSHNLHPQVTGFVHASRFFFFPSIFFFQFLQFRGDNLFTKVMQ